MVPFESLGAVSYLPSIVIMGLSCISPEIKRDIGQKSWFFSYPLHLMPPLGGPRPSIAIPFVTEKLYGEKRLTIWLPVSTESTNVTDTDTSATFKPKIVGGRSPFSFLLLPPVPSLPFSLSFLPLSLPAPFVCPPLSSFPPLPLPLT